MRRLILAIGFLTRIPVPRLASEPDDFAGAIRLYPLVGLAIGALVCAAGVCGARVDPWTGALAALVAWIWVTGALHLDGLADLSDGLGAAHGDRRRLLEVMADPHVGSFGVTAIGLQLAAKLVLLHAVIPGHWPALLAVPCVARLGPLVWARALPPLKPDGLGAAITGSTRGRDLIGWAAALAGGCVLLPTLCAGAVLIGALAFLFRHKLGGMTGDVHGAGIELVESGLLLACAAMPGL